MTRSLTLAVAIGAALVLCLSSTEKANAWFGRNGGSNGSCGSHGGSFGGSFGGSYGSGGSFGGLFSRRGNHGGSCGDTYGCGVSGEVHYGDGSDSTTPPPAPKDPGTATGSQPGGETSAALEPNAANIGQKPALVASKPTRMRWFMR
jgi:hypothetical protein